MQLRSQQRGQQTSAWSYIWYGIFIQYELGRHLILFLPLLSSLLQTKLSTLEWGVRGGSNMREKKRSNYDPPPSFISSQPTLDSSKREGHHSVLNQVECFQCRMQLDVLKYWTENVLTLEVTIRFSITQQGTEQLLILQAFSSKHERRNRLKGQRETDSVSGWCSGFQKW